MEEAKQQQQQQQQQQPTKVAINGFGRIGRLVCRLVMDRPELELVLINEHHGDAQTQAYLVEFDSVHGTWDRRCTGSDCGGFVDIGAKKGSKGESEGGARRVAFSGHTDPAAVDWKGHGVELLFECTGALKTRAKLLPVLEAGAVKRIVVSAPVKDADVPDVVVGVNDEVYDPATHDIVTAASCTTNCLAPVVKVLHEQIGIRHGMITTLHDVTNTQCVIDTAWPGGKEIRRTRGSLMNMVPTTTGSAKAIQVIFPELKGKLDGHAVRVPLANGSLTDAVFEMKRPVTAEEVNGLLSAAARGEGAYGALKGVLGVEDRPLVSSDYTNNAHSGVVDLMSTMVTDDTQLKVYIWYDNEMGYSCRCVDLGLRAAAALRA